MEILDKFQNVGLKNILPDEVNAIIFKFHKVHPTAEILKPYIRKYHRVDDDEDLVEIFFPHVMLRDTKYCYELTVFCRRCGEAISERTYIERMNICALIVF